MSTAAASSRQIALAFATARAVHEGQHDRRGRPMFEHVERVAARVPDHARAVAYVHDLCERSASSPADVASIVGLTGPELDALELLTSPGDEEFAAHVHRIVSAPTGEGREIAIHVKRADILDHLDHGAPESYATALRALERAAQDRSDAGRETSPGDGLD